MLRFRVISRRKTPRHKNVGCLPLRQRGVGTVAIAGYRTLLYGTTILESDTVSCIEHWKILGNERGVRSKGSKKHMLHEQPYYISSVQT